MKTLHTSSATAENDCAAFSCFLQASSHRELLSSEHIHDSTGAQPKPATHTASPAPQLRRCNELRRPASLARSTDRKQPSRREWKSIKKGPTSPLRRFRGSLINRLTGNSEPLDKRHVTNMNHAAAYRYLLRWDDFIWYKGFMWSEKTAFDIMKARVT